MRDQDEFFNRPRFLRSVPIGGVASLVGGIDLLSLAQKKEHEEEVEITPGEDLISGSC